MKAIDWLDSSYPCLSQDSTIAEALTYLRQHQGLSELPIRLRNGKFGGFFSLDQLSSEVDQKEFASTYCFAEQSKVQSISNYYEVLRTSQLHQGLSVAVTDKEHRYLGTISPSKMIVGMSLFSALRSPGVVISLRLREEDYVLSELVQIIESNQVKILDLTLVHLPKSVREVLLLLKLSCQDSSVVRTTLQRYGYEVLEYQSSFDQLENQEKKNYEALMKYLDL